MAVKKTTAPKSAVTEVQTAAKAKVKTPAETAAKSATKPAAKSADAAAPAAVAPGVKAAPKLVRRKEMVARIVASSGLKPNQVKTMLDSVLAELGNALSAGEGLSLPPLGKITVNRQKEVGNREVLICKLRRKTGDAPAAAPETGPLETAAKER
jgi:Bacterial DNA-binding protein